MREALLRLNPEIAAQPDRADDVLYRLRAILMGVRTDGLVRANEEFAAWLAGERSMPFGADGEHVTVRLVDLEDVERNQYVVTTQYTVRSGANERRADLVLLVNGLPLVVIEAKTPVRSSQSWFDGATQVHDDYERNVPDLFVPNLCSVATEGKDLRYGSIGLPVNLWGPWRAVDDAGAPTLERGQADRLVDTPPYTRFWICWGVTRPTPRARGSDEPRSLRGTSRSRRRTASSSGSSPATPRRVWSGTSRVPASRS